MGPVPILKPEIDVEKEDKKCSYSLSVGVSHRIVIYTLSESHFLMSQKCRSPTDLQKHEKVNIVHVSIPSYMTPLGCAKIPRFFSFTSFSHHRKYQLLTKSRSHVTPMYKSRIKKKRCSSRNPKMYYFLFCYFYKKNFNCLKYRHIVRLLHIVRSI